MSNLHRDVDFGSAAQNDLIDAMITEMGGGSRRRVFLPGSRGANTSPSAQPVVKTPNALTQQTVINTSEIIFVAGQLIGMDGATGLLALALAGTYRAITICTGLTAKNAPLIHSPVGVQNVLVEADISPTFADFAYVSMSEAGTGTNVAPSTGLLFGQFVGEKDPATGTAPVAVHIDLASVRLLGV